jgi:hypothetical protein
VKRRVEYPPQSPDITPLNCYVWDNIKSIVCSKKQRRLQDLRYKIEIMSVAVLLATLQEVCHYVACCYQQCIGAADRHFEHLCVYGNQ